MAASAVVSPLTAQVKLANTFATGTALRHGRTSVSMPASGNLQIVAMKKLMGKVVTSTNDKSVTVEVSRIAPHSKYQKRVKSFKNYVVHDPENQCKIGDVVTLAKCAPVSKRKTFVVVEIRTVDGAITEVGGSLDLPFESAVPAS